MQQRTLARRIDLPAPKRGQFGADHRVVEVITPEQWAAQDPFILLMDDRLDGTLRGGPHPHAGFETVTFPLVGRIASEGSTEHLAPGDVEWTTAGNGIVHGSAATVRGTFRLLQLWLTLPSALRWTEPDNQIIRAADAPVRHEAGAEIRVYSGASGAVTSPTRNRVPVTLLDVRLEPGARIAQILPASFNGFLYVIDGAIVAGEVELRPGQIGWLDRASGTGDTELALANPSGTAARVLVYAGERQNVSLVSYGPFIGESEGDIVHSIERFKTGAFRDYTR